MRVIRSEGVRARGTSGTPTEIVAMATEARGLPASALRRRAFAHVISEVIRTRGDEPILQAIAAAPNPNVARVIRAAAEGACEALSIVADGAEHDVKLFSVPIVVRFPEPIATREFEDELAAADWCQPFLARLHDGACHTRSSILPHVFRFDDLASLSFSRVRNGALLASVIHPRAVTDTISPFAVATPAQRRSATFLRYLVGFHVTGRRSLSGNALGHARFRNCVRSVMRANLPDAQDIVAIYSERFYEPIWQGLWSYHTHRLAEVVGIIAARGGARSRISASISVVTRRQPLVAQLAFFCRGRAELHHAYTVPIRPLDDPQISARRIALRLRALGVTRHVGARTAEVHGRERWPIRGAAGLRRELSRNELTLPL